MEINFLNVKEIVTIDLKKVSFDKVEKDDHKILIINLNIKVVCIVDYHLDNRIEDDIIEVINNDIKIDIN